MSLNAPIKDKMIHAPIAKRGFHFASDGLHFAEFIEADSIEEATEAYHKIKRLMPGQSPATPMQSTPASMQEQEQHEL